MDVFYDPPKEGCNINRELEPRATFVSALYNVCQRKFGILALVVKKQLPPPIPDIPPREANTVANAEHYATWQDQVKARNENVRKRVKDLPLIIGEITARINPSFVTSMPDALVLRKDIPTVPADVIAVMEFFKK